MTRLPALSPFLLALPAGFALAASAPGGVTISINDLEYKPAEVSIRAGDTIKWVNGDVLDHTATVEGLFDLVIEAGKAGETRFTHPGTFEYICRYHPNMKGRITVDK